MEGAEQDSRVRWRYDGVLFQWHRAADPVAYFPLENLTHRVQRFRRLDAFLQADAIVMKELAIAGDYAAQWKVIIEESQQSGNARTERHTIKRWRMFAATWSSM